MITEDNNTTHFRKDRRLLYEEHDCEFNRLSLDSVSPAYQLQPVQKKVANATQMAFVSQVEGEIQASSAQTAKLHSLKEHAKALAAEKARYMAAKRKREWEDRKSQQKKPKGDSSAGRGKGKGKSKSKGMFFKAP
jgi:hypothetical protein